jgi:hypothetical protein
MRLHFGRDQRNNSPVVMIEPKVEPLDALALLRNLRDNFPDDFAKVAAEITVPPDKKLILNGQFPKK